MATFQCQRCGATFRKSPSQRDYGKAKFCSRRCQHAAQIRGRLVPCQECGKDIWTRPSTREKFCSNACRGRWQHKHWRGPANPHWKGGRRLSKHGYIIVGKTRRGKSLYEHRAVVERVLGRELTAQETVHHINGIKTDNRPENLLVVTVAEHRKIEIEMAAAFTREHLQGAANPREALEGLLPQIRVRSMGGVQIA